MTLMQRASEAFGQAAVAEGGGGAGGRSPWLLSDARCHRNGKGVKCLLAIQQCERDIRSSNMALFDS
jgi:hypothetical protein